jgi:hypothetical protein
MDPMSISPFARNGVGAIGKTPPLEELRSIVSPFHLTLPSLPVAARRLAAANSRLPKTVYRPIIFRRFVVLVERTRLAETRPALDILREPLNINR